jgi:hypothetical protein
MEDRLPLRPKMDLPGNSDRVISAQESAARVTYEARKEEFTKIRSAFLLNRAEESKRFSIANIAEGKKIRQRFDGS